MDEEFLDYKLKTKEFTPDFSLSNTCIYDTVVLKDALEFVDLVFDNNLDKTYFLRQYFKDFQEIHNAKIAVKAKGFVR